MVKRSTWILLAILVLAIGAYFLINKKSSKVQGSPIAVSDSYLITQSDGVLQSVLIFDAKNNKFQMQKDMSKTWVITVPTLGAADQGPASAAETQVGALKIVTTLGTASNPAVMGLDVPAHTLEFGFVTGTNHKIEVGNLTATSSGYYVRYDDKKYFVISQSGIDALLNLLTAPPYPATATPDTTALPSDTTATPTP